MELNFKKFHPDAKTPTKGHPQDAAYDMYVSRVGGWNGMFYEVFFDIGIDLPPNTKALIYPRSSVSKKGLSLANSVGVIDPGFKQGISARFYCPNQVYYPLEVGERAVQLCIEGIADIDWKEVENLEGTDRGEGYGSSGRF